MRNISQSVTYHSQLVQVKCLERYCSKILHRIHCRFELILGYIFLDLHSEVLVIKYIYVLFSV